jgi:hypothetical protein
MKNNILFIFLLLNISHRSIAQTATTLTYDANGNRLGKQMVGTSPHPTVAANPAAVNPSQPSILTASGCTGGSVWWLHNGQTSNSVTVNPTVTTTYEARCIVNGCANPGVAKITVNVIQCPSVTLSTRSYPENLVRYGQPMTLFADGCNGAGRYVEWSSGNMGTPIGITMYGSSQIYTATCRTQFCPSLGTAAIVVGGQTGCLNGDVLITIKDGSWNDPSVWSCNRLPNSSDVVYVNHQITVYGIAGYAKSIIKGNSGTLNYDNLGTIYIPQN